VDPEISKGGHPQNIETLTEKKRKKKVILGLKS
jgi:hypothetical protein